MHNRLEKFEKSKIHPHYSRLYKRLKRNEIEMIENFILENANLDHSDFEFKLNRLFLNKEKSKNWSLILEFLMISNNRDIKNRFRR